jgi:serine carboxypeptidase-like clade I
MKLLLRMRLRHRRLSSPPLTRLLACLLLLLLPLSRAATVVTRLPGFHGPLPFYLETGWVSRP